MNVPLDTQENNTARPSATPVLTIESQLFFLNIQFQSMISYTFVD